MDVILDLLIREPQNIVATLSEICVLSFVSALSGWLAVPIKAVALNNEIVRQKEINLEFIEHDNLFPKLYPRLRHCISHGYFNVCSFVAHQAANVAEQVMSLAAVTLSSYPRWIGFKFFATIIANDNGFRFPFMVIFAGIHPSVCDAKTLLRTVFLNLCHGSSDAKFPAAVLANHGYLSVFLVKFFAACHGVFAVTGTILGLCGELAGNVVCVSTFLASLRDNFHSSLQKVNPAGAASVVQADPISLWGSWKKENAVIGYVCLNSKDYITL